MHRAVDCPPWGTTRGGLRCLETSGPGIGLRWFHRATSFLLFPSIIAFAVSAIALMIAHHRRTAMALPIGLSVVVLFASFTGYLLPWDQLSLTSVTVGESIQGYGKILTGDRVKYVLIGSQEIGASTLARWYWVHSGVLPLAVLGLLVGTVATSRARRSSEVGAGPQGAELLPHE